MPSFICSHFFSSADTALAYWLDMMSDVSETDSQSQNTCLSVSVLAMRSSITLISGGVITMAGSGAGQIFPCVDVCT